MSLLVIASIQGPPMTDEAATRLREAVAEAVDFALAMESYEADGVQIGLGVPMTPDQMLQEMLAEEAGRVEHDLGKGNE